MSVDNEENSLIIEEKKIIFFFLSLRYSSNFVNTDYSKHDMTITDFHITVKDEISFPRK